MSLSGSLNPGSWNLLAHDQGSIHKALKPDILGWTAWGLWSHNSVHGDELQESSCNPLLYRVGLLRIRPAL